MEKIAIYTTVLLNKVKGWYSQLSTQLAIGLVVGVLVFLALTTYSPATGFTIVLVIAVAASLFMVNEDAIKRYFRSED